MDASGASITACRANQMSCFGLAGKNASTVIATNGASRTATSWTPEESKIESSEHQDNASIHAQPFPELVSEEREIYTDYDGCHCYRVKHSSYLSVHFSQPSQDDPMFERI